LKKHQITKAEYESTKATARENKDKRIDKRLQVIILRYEGKKDREIGEKLDYHRKRVSQLCAEFKAVGLEEYASIKYGGNHSNLSNEEEEAFLLQFEEAAKKGQIITIAEIAAAYDEKTGKNRDSRSTVYYLLKKHSWRQITPQTAHPDKASEAEIEASKKLTSNWRK
jgi:transposase